MDIRDIGSVVNIFDAFKPEVVIQAAAMTDVGPYETQQEKFWELNVKATESIINICNAHNSRLIYVSTILFLMGRLVHTQKMTC